MSISTEEKERLALLAGKIFTPATPVNDKDLFAGRIQQVRRVVDAVGQDSNHVIIYGERGVGKTSFSNILSYFVSLRGEPVLPIRVNCDSGDTFSSVWRKIFRRIILSSETRTAGFASDTSISVDTLESQYPSNKQITPDDVLHTLTPLGKKRTLMCIIDEFDRITNTEDKRLFADLIKTLSDYNTPATILLVGVADSVPELIAEHESIERALVQVQMPRMDKAEIIELLNRVTQLNLRIDEDAQKLIIALSKGLPHYAHLLGLYASRHVIDNNLQVITSEAVQNAVATALQNSQQSIIVKYNEATSSPRETIYPQVLLACALAESNELGYFTANNVCAPLSMIMHREYSIPGFAKNLNDLCSPQRGRVLQQRGEPRKRYYRFSNPLMQPYIIMKGLSDNMISGNFLEKIV